jgi:sugar lactone lactonase YvrE
VASGSVTTWAGADNAAGNVNGAPTTARFNTPSGIGVDASQNQVLIADTANGSIRAIPFSFVGGNLVAGSVSSRYSGLTSPTTVHVSENRSVAVAETGLDRVRVYNAGSSREAIFGGTSGNLNGDGNLARFFRPLGITSIGNTFYVADTGNAQVRRIKLKDGAAPLLAANWTVSVLAGSGNAFFQDGSGTTAAFGNVADLATDNQSRLVAADSGSNAVRQIVSDGSFDFGTPDGTGGGEAALVNLTGIADLNGLQRPYIDLDKTIQPGETVDAGEWQFSIPPGVSAFRFAVTVEAATPFYAGLEAVLNPTLGPGSPNVVAQFLNRPSANPVFTGTLETVWFTSANGSLAYDRAGNLYCADYFSTTIRRITPTGRVTTVAGRENSPGIVDGSGTQARLDSPTAVLVNEDGTEIFVADSLGEVIRRIALTSGSDPGNADNWTVTTIAGSAGVAGDANGSGAQARFRFPSGLAALNTDAIFICESTGNRIRLLKYIGGNRSLPASWTVEGVCGSAVGTAGFADTFGANARFNNPNKIALTKSGALLVADSNNNRIRSVDTRTTLVTTLAGSGSSVYSDSAVATSAGIPLPYYLAADDSGAVYFASDVRIRRILNGTVKTVAGGGNGSASTGDKLAFGGNITGLTLNRQGDLLFVAGDRLVRLTRKLGR